MSDPNSYPGGNMPPQPPFGNVPPQPQQPGFYDQNAQYGGAPQPQYGGSGYDSQPQTKTISIVGLVLSILVPLAGVIVSHIALSKAKTLKEPTGLAKAGVIVGWVLLALSIIFTILITVLIGAAAKVATEELENQGYTISEDGELVYEGDDLGLLDEEGDGTDLVYIDPNDGVGGYNVDDATQQLFIDSVLADGYDVNANADPEMLLYIGNAVCAGWETGTETELRDAFVAEDTSGEYVKVYDIVVDNAHILCPDLAPVN